MSVINNSKEKNAPALHGLYRSIIANLITGVSVGYKIELELNGVGYRVQKQGSGLKLTLGYSHPIEIKEIQGIQFETVGQNEIVINGIDKQKVGQVAANIIKLRDARHDPYKNKGVKYKGAVLLKKAGKKVK